MNYVKKAAFSLLLVIPAAYSSAVSAGSIVIAKENGAICVLPLPELPKTSVVYNFRITSSPCDHFNDNVRTITFLGVPSATKVTLGENEGNKGRCTKVDTHEFITTLKTTKKQTTTKNIELDHLSTYKPNQIIAPGLQMVSIDAPSHLRDKLSCVQIQISEAPPVTSTP